MRLRVLNLCWQDAAGVSQALRVGDVGIRMIGKALYCSDYNQIAS